jgi:hypothetical protein
VQTHTEGSSFYGSGGARLDHLVGCDEQLSARMQNVVGDISVLGLKNKWVSCCVL